MPKLSEIFKKQGGMQLIKRYVKSGVLFTAMAEFVLLGKSRTALEILRLSTILKTEQKLYKKYIGSLKQFDKEYDSSLPQKQSNKVWVCWFQGIENAPEVVKRCYQSLRDNLTDREIILLTSDNIEEYVKFPAYIYEKWRSGQITHTHMTDLLRLELLIKYGGTWIDSTVLCTRKRNQIPDYFFDSDLFFYQNLKPGRDGHATVLSSWYMCGCTNNKILMAVRYLCYEYWKNHNDMVDYFLLHDFFQIVIEYYEDDWKKVIPYSNATPHILLLRLFDKYDEKMFECILGQTPFHKLSYKFTDEQRDIPDTYYQKLFVKNN